MVGSLLKSQRSLEIATDLRQLLPVLRDNLSRLQYLPNHNPLILLECSVWSSACKVQAKHYKLRSCGSKVLKRIE
jgi:hypothetical protein